MKTNWVRSSIVEEHLKSIKNLRFEYRIINISNLKIKESLISNSRFKSKLDMEHVNRLSIGMASKKPFVPPIVTSSNEIISGNHRIAAASEIDTEIYAYVLLNADKDTKELIRRTDNADHGLSLSKDELLQQAVYLHNHHNLTISEAARKMNLKYDMVQSYVNSTKVREYLESKGVNTINLHHSVLVLLHTFDDYDIIEEMGRTAAVGRFTYDQVKIIVDELKKKNGKENKIAHIKEFRGSIVALKDKRSAFKPIRNKLLNEADSDKGICKLIANISSFDDTQFVSVDEAKSVIAKLKSAVTKLEQICKKK